MLSVVVATYNDPLGLYLTVEGLFSQLSTLPCDWEIVIAADGGSNYDWESLTKTRCLRLTGGNRTGSPQGTRDAGIRVAKYNHVLCIESHVIVFNLAGWLETHMRMGDPALSFPVRIHEGPSMRTVWGSETDWDGNLWYKKHLYEPKSMEPHMCVQFGHSAFILRRDWYIEHGGYTSLLKGWGGEEPFLCLKAWMLGERVWQFPQVSHAHYLTPGRHQDDMAKETYENNFKIVRYVMSGEVPKGLKVTSEMRAEREKICSGPWKGDLFLLRQWLNLNGVD
jgi:glycosyltransferase involved in cell wall biosynthesis